MDVLSASQNDDTIAWYENYTVLGTDDTNLVEITIYPNPINEIFNINTPNNVAINSLQIYNSLGVPILHIYNPSHKIEVSNLPTGLFFVQMTTNEGVITKKIIKE
jgi:hypothetical protein